MDRLDWTVDDLSRRLKDLRYEAEPQTIYTWIAPNRPRRPRQRTIDGLQRLFGAVAPVEQDPSDLGRLLPAIEGLIGVMERQTLALEELAQRMQDERDAGPAWARAVVDAVLAGRALTSEAREPDERAESEPPRPRQGE